MPINKDLVSKKLDFLNNYLHKIESMDFSEEAFVEDADIHDLIVFRLQQAVETCIDIAAHIIAGLEAPQKETAKDAFIFLGEKEIINCFLRIIKKIYKIFVNLGRKLLHTWKVFNN